MMVAIVSAVREGDIFKHLQAERELLKLVFAFDHVHYGRYNTYQHVLLCSMQRNIEDGFKDLSIYVHGSASTGLRFSAIHGDLVTEHFNRETKGTAGPFRSGYSTDLRALNRWIKTSHIHSKLRVAVKKEFRLYTSSTHKELTIRNKRRHLQHVQKLKRTLQDYGIDSFGTGPSQNLVTGKEINGDLVKGLLGAAKNGNKAYLNFVNQRLVEGNKTLFNPIPKINLMTQRRGNQRCQF